MDHPNDGLLGKNIVEILPQEDDPDRVLGLLITYKITRGRFLNNGKGNGTRESGPRIHNKNQPGYEGDTGNIMVGHSQRIWVTLTGLYDPGNW